MIDTQAIRNKILDLAMKGLLTEQLPEDGTADELYQRIQTEKQALLKAGVVKKEKRVSTVESGNIPYNLPDNWRWCRLIEIAYLTSGNQYEEAEQGIPYIKVADMNLPENKKEIITSSRFTSIDNIGMIPVSSIIFPKRGGAILTNKKRIVLKTPIFIDSNTMAMTMILPEILLFLKCWFDSINLGDLYTGTAIPQINNKDIYPMLVPLPPLAEQRRIVEKIDQAFSVLDTIDTLQAQYANNLTTLKAKLIDAAIQGKLTEQLPEDGTAEELYQQIQEEKQALIKAGKLKKEKPLPEIKDEEIPFEIPKNWKWIRFSDLYSLSNGVASRGTPGGVPHPVLRLADLVNGHISTDSIRKIDLSDDEFSGHKVQKGDLVFIRVNGSRDKVATAFLYQGEEDISYCDHLFCGHKISNLFDASFVMTVYHSTMAKAQIDPEIKTTAGQNTINQKSMGKIMIPLPPLAEQKRIVARLEEMMSVF